MTTLGLERRAKPTQSLDEVLEEISCEDEARAAEVAKSNTTDVETEAHS